MKCRIIHCIDSLERGGAEVLLNNTISLLPEFDHTVIVLGNEASKGIHFTSPAPEIVYLNFRGWKSFFRCVNSMRREISKRDPVLVHSHLLVSTMFARLSVPRKIPLVSTIHSLYSKDAFENSTKSIWSERLGKKRHALIAVSNTVLQDYLNVIPFKGKKFVLYNFIPSNLFKAAPLYKKDNNGTAKFIAVGNLRAAKNYIYLFQIFRYLKDEPVELDIYGQGYQQDELQAIIDREGLKINLKGSSPLSVELLDNYHHFIQASEHEGFGLSVIEAMASGLPVFLSDIAVFREITNELAVFFPLNNAMKAAELISHALSQKEMLGRFSEEGAVYVKKHYSQEHYRERLLKIYADITNRKTLESCVELQDS